MIPYFRKVILECLGKPVSIEMSHEMHGTEGTMSAGPNDTQLQLPIENLSPSCVDTDILHLFQGLDVREVDLQMDSSKRQCTGRALVQFGSEEAFSKALKYEGMMLLGRFQPGPDRSMNLAAAKELWSLEVVLCRASPAV